jgi:co-chaperonin GroES (HSP10)
MNIQPVEFKVLIKPDKVESQTKGGLWLTDHSVDKQQFSVDRGEVISFGEGFYSNLPGPTPKIGDKVLFNKYAGTVLDIWEKEEGRDVKVSYRMINDKDICAIMEE